eukprot:gene24536-30892_t
MFEVSADGRVQQISGGVAGGENTMDMREYFEKSLSTTCAIFIEDSDINISPTMFYNPLSGSIAQAKKMVDDTLRISQDQEQTRRRSEDFLSDTERGIESGNEQESVVESVPPIRYHLIHDEVEVEEER